MDPAQTMTFCTIFHEPSIQADLLKNNFQEFHGIQRGSFFRIFRNIFQGPGIYSDLLNYFYGPSINREFRKNTFLSTKNLRGFFSIFFEDQGLCGDFIDFLNIFKENVGDSKKIQISPNLSKVSQRNLLENLFKTLD